MLLRLLLLLRKIPKRIQLDRIMLRGYQVALPLLLLLLGVVRLCRTPSPIAKQTQHAVKKLASEASNICCDAESYSGECSMCSYRCQWHDPSTTLLSMPLQSVAPAAYMSAY